jgi:hypothetical protein
VDVTVPANGSVTATFSVATTFAATRLGSDTFTLRSTSPGVTADTRILDLRVLPQQAGFTTLNWTTADTSASACANGVSADVTDVNPGQGIDNWVRFLGWGGTTMSLQLSSSGYALTPGCRGAVVLSPDPAAGDAATIFNLGFPSATGGSPGSRFNLGAAAYAKDDFRVAADGSFLITVAGSNRDAVLANMVTLSRVGTHVFTGTLAAEVDGTLIHVTPSVSNAWDWPLR